MVKMFDDLQAKQRAAFLKRWPTEVLAEKSALLGLAIDSLEFARRMDVEDEFRRFRQLFSFPKKMDLPNVDRKWINDDSEESLYFCGQSLGLKPKAVDNYVKDVMDNWGTRGVHSHFHGYLPAALCDLPPKEPMAMIVGAKASEVSILNALSVNLHLLLATFYQPSGDRFKILIEEHAFPSDMYAVKSHLRLHGYPVNEGLVLLKPRNGEQLLRHEDMMDLLRREGDQIAVALFPCVQYYTGQLLNVQELTRVAKSKGITVGIDLAHAVGNVPLELHNWKVDFAAWCTYKYMCSGAGAIGCIFIHEDISEKNHGDPKFPMLQGWWGNSLKTKFMMNDEFDPIPGADVFKLSNPSPLLMACLMASLDIFSQTSVEDLRRKQFLLTGYLEYLLNRYFPKSNPCNNNSSVFGTYYNALGNNGDLYHKKMPTVDVITPTDPAQRGAQLSLTFSIPLNAVQQELQKRGVVCDVRMPSVMRVAPIPLYNSFEDVYKFVHVLRDVIQAVNVDEAINDVNEIKCDIAVPKPEDICVAKLVESGSSKEAKKESKKDSKKADFTIETTKLGPMELSFDDSRIHLSAVSEEPGSPIGNSL